MLAWAERAAARLAELEGDDERIDELRREHEELTARLAELAAELTAIRTRAAERFGRAVTEELAALAMPHARVSVAVTQTGEFGPARRGRGGDPARRPPRRAPAAARQGRLGR